ncbi:MAG: hypothetical protein E6772_01630 [Dysgonomonas sp.]|nr:hypothetical protein [Dysgonomonas sp.]
MSATLLRSTPMSGEFREYYFGQPSGLWIWVLFEANDFDNWYGCFAGAACYGYNEVLIDKENSTAFVIAAGTYYMVDINKRELISEPDPSVYISDSMQSTNPDYFIAASSSDIYIFDGREMTKKIPFNHLLQDIKLLEQNGNKIKGSLIMANKENTKYLFELDLISHEINFIT